MHQYVASSVGQSFQTIQAVTDWLSAWVMLCFCMFFLYLMLSFVIFSFVIGYICLLLWVNVKCFYASIAYLNFISFKKKRRFIKFFEIVVSKIIWKVNTNKCGKKSKNRLKMLQDKQPKAAANRYDNKSTSKFLSTTKKIKYNELK